MDKSNNQLIVLVILRVLIGWHFLYEGLIKLFDPTWSAVTYLNGAEGPLSSAFKAMARSEVLLGFVDFFNPIALVVIGLSLFLGLGSRWLSLGGVLLLLMYYLSYPPFIGLDQPMAEGNYLIVNKNMIEACALVVLYFFPECHQVGLNRFFRR